MLLSCICFGIKNIVIGKVFINVQIAPYTVKMKLRCEIDPPQLLASNFIHTLEDTSEIFDYKWEQQCEKKTSLLF